MSDRPVIDHTVDEKIDAKIVEAQLPEVKSLDTAGALAASTTVEEQRTAYGQRRVNLLWEFVQGTCGLMLVGTACYSVIIGNSLPAEFWLLLGIVVNSYFTRTNHTKIGGIGGTDSR